MDLVRPRPRDYIPPIEVTIVEKRRAIPLDKNEGIYVRDGKSGAVRAVVGETYLLKPSEVLWEKVLPAAVEQLLGRKSADRTRVVTYPVPHNSACQIYDYKSRVARVVFGPELAMLQPDEQFTVLSLSGSKPKKPHQIKAIRLQLGPDFSTDIITLRPSTTLASSCSCRTTGCSRSTRRTRRRRRASSPSPTSSATSAS